jgi:hypothetical protein
MLKLRYVRSIQMVLLSVLITLGLLSATSSFAAESYTTKPFTGVKANSGTATLTKASPATLTFSDDFKIPDAPAPSWQVVDSKGNIYLLNQLRIKGNKINRTITLPSYIHDVAKVQIWCSFAEVLLGEAPFDKVVILK